MENSVEKDAPDHAVLVEWVSDSETASIHSRAISEKSRDYYDSKQYTPAEIATLKKRKQAATVINRIKPKVDSLLGMEKGAKTTVKAYARTPQHEKAADAATEAIRFVLQDNFFDQVRSAAWENLIIEGTCGCEIIAKPGKNDEIRLTINHLMWDRLIYDPYSRRKDLSDARYLGQLTWMDYSEAISLYPDGKTVLEVMSGSNSTTYDDKPTWFDGKRKRVKVVELYYHHKGDVWYSCFTEGGYLKAPQISPYINEEGETEWPYEFASAFVTRNGDRYGAVMQLLDIQDEINKRRSKALHLMSVRQVKLERGAVEDVNKTREQLATPDGVIEITPGMEFEVLKTGDMAAAQFNLLAEAKQEIDAIGANAAMTGRDQTAVSGRALQARQSAGQSELGPLFDALKHLQLRVFRKTWNRVRQYWKEEKWIRVTDDEQNLRWVGLNKPITKGEEMLKQAQAQGAPPEALQQLQQQIAQDPSMQQTVSTENDLATLDVDIILSDVPDVLTAQIEDFQVLGEMVKSGFQMPPLAVIEASPLRNKEKIMKMMKEQSQSQLSPEHEKQMQQMQDESEKLKEENQRLKSGAEEAQAQLQMKQQMHADEMQLKTQEAQAELQLKQQTQNAELQMERDRIEATLELERVKQEGAYNNQREKMQFDMNCKKIEHSDTGEQKEAESQSAPELGTLVSDLATAFNHLSQTMQGQQERHDQMLEMLMRPKTVSIGGIQKDSSGRITGATIVQE